MKNLCNSGAEVNLGRAACDVKMGVPTGIILSYGRTVITEEDAADLTKMLAKTQADTYAARLQPYTSGFQQITDNSTEATVDTQSSTGYTEKLADGSIVFAFGFPNKVCLGKQVVALENAGFTHAFVIAGGYVWGVANGDALQGFPIKSLYVTGAGFNTDSVKPIQLNINFGSDIEFDKNREGLKLGYPPDMIVGLDTYEVTATGTAKKYALAQPCTGSNPYGLYKNELASPAAWKVTGADGTAITVSGVTADDETEAFALTFEAPTSGSYTVNLAAPSVLTEAGVSGIVGKGLTVNVG